MMSLFAKQKIGFTIKCNKCGKNGCNIKANATAMYGQMYLKVMITCKNCGTEGSWNND